MANIKLYNILDILYSFLDGQHKNLNIITVCNIYR